MSLSDVVSSTRQLVDSIESVVEASPDECLTLLRTMDRAQYIVDKMKERKLRALRQEKENSTIQQVVEQKTLYQDLLNALCSKELITQRLFMISHLVSKVTIDSVLFHLALATRNEVVIRLFLEQIPVTEITPEQLEFFTPYDTTDKEKQNAIQLSTILFEKKYPFGKDDTSQWFLKQMKELTM